MKKVTFRGTGQLNGPVIINKTLELEDKIAQGLTGANKDEVKSAILDVHFPGVKINPRQISVEIVNIKKKAAPKDTSKSSVIAGAIAGAVTNKVISKSKKDDNPKKKNKTNKESNSNQSSIKSMIVETGKGFIDDFKNQSKAKKEKINIYNQKKEEVFKLPIPNTVNEIIEQIDFLLLCINNEGWTNNQEESYKNNYTDLCFEKFKQLLNRLPQDDSNHSYYKSKLKKLKLKRFFKKIFG